MGYNKEDAAFYDLMFGTSTMARVADRRRLPPMQFEKTIYNYEKKSQEIVYKALEIEVEHIKKTNPGYELKEFSKPIFNNDGSATYFITFTK